jgi:16S rRNA (guanine966-N2)-methyltransferase
MRISGGTAKGRKVGMRKAFVSKGDSDELRPTASKVREAIFNIVGGRIIESRFLDLYAGTGAVGIEALSRSAAHAVLVDDNACRVALIRDLIDKFGFVERAAVVKHTVAAFLRKTAQAAFDIIFLDPPYASDELRHVLPAIDKSNLLADDGIVIVEHSSKQTLSNQFENLTLKKTYRYGDTALTLFKYTPCKIPPTDERTVS